MKKTISFLLTSVLCVAFFTGCPHETPVNQVAENKNPETAAAGQTSKIQNPETDNDKYPRTFMFNKEEFDTQYKAWSDAGIKNYQFKEIFDPDAYNTTIGRSVIRLITVKEGKIESVRYFDANNSDYKEIKLDTPPDWLTENGIAELKKDIRTIDEIYVYLADWYERNNNTWDLKTMGIATYGRLMEYDESFHFPSYYQFRYITEFEYDAMMNNDSVVGYNSFIGWRSEIFDFKVLD